MDFTIVFGDVFRYRGEEYVYFAESPEDGLIFAGKVLDTSDSTQLVSMQERHQTKGKDTHKAPVYSYVVLSTDEFAKRAVLCAAGVDASKQLSYPHATLESEDRDAIKEEILSGPAPAKLKKLIELLT
jgi:hypothetical protein